MFIYLPFVPCKDIVLISVMCQLVMSLYSDLYVLLMVKCSTIVMLKSKNDLKHLIGQIIFNVTSHMLENDLIFISWGALLHSSWYKWRGFGAPYGHCYIQLCLGSFIIVWLVRFHVDYKFCQSGWSRITESSNLLLLHLLSHLPTPPTPLFCTGTL